MRTIKRLCYNKNMRKLRGKQGFTLVELSLAVGFIALLSLTVTLIINDTVATYRRGITLNNINTTGMDLVDDIRAAIQSSPARSVLHECEALYSNASDIATCKNDHAGSLIILQKKADVVIDGEKANIPVYGAFCTGAYSYIWNSGYFFDDDDSNVIGAEPAYFTYDDAGKMGSSSSATSIGRDPDNYFRLLKVKDEKRAVCKSSIRDSKSSYGSYKFAKNIDLNRNFDITKADSSMTGGISYYDGGVSPGNVEVVMDDEITNPLALYDLTITPPVSNVADDAAFYSVSFILGTLMGGLNVNAIGNFCKTPTDYDEDFDYCAINKFNFAAQATGG